MDCTDCGRTCASVRDLENHRRQEHCVASCHLCGKPFFSQNHLSVHLKQVHDIGQKEDGKYNYHPIFTNFGLMIEKRHKFLSNISIDFYRIHMRNVRQKLPNQSIP